MLKMLLGLKTNNFNEYYLEGYSVKIKITNNAAIYLNQKVNSLGDGYAVRVFIKSKRCCSLDLGMAFDLQKDNDNAYDENGVTFIVNKKMAKYIKGFKVDVINYLIGEKIVIEDLYKTNCC